MPTVQYLDLFINTATQSLVLGVANQQGAPVPVWIQDDQPNLRIWLVQPVPGQTGQYQLMNTSGVTVEAALGTITNDTPTILANQYAFTPSGLSDPTQQYWTGVLALNTTSIATALATQNQITVLLEVKYLVGGVPTTVLQINVQLKAALIQLGSLQIPPGQTAATLQYVNATFLQRNIVGPIILVDPVNGHQIALYCKADGTLGEDQIA